MSLKNFKNIFLILFFCSCFQSLYAAENLKSLGKFKDWESFVHIQDGNKICFAQSMPLVRAPKKLKRDPSRLFVSFRPSESIKNEISLTSGYLFKVGSSVKAKSGKRSFDLFTKDSFAWLADNEEDLAMIKKMKKASRFMITGNTSKGEQTTDHYSMMGFTKAYAAAKKNCS